MKEKEVLAAAKEALEDAFGPKANEHTVKVTSSPSHGITPSDLNTIIKEVGGKLSIETAIANANVHNSSFEEVPESDAKKKNIAETKKLMDNFHEIVVTPRSQENIDKLITDIVEAYHPPEELTRTLREQVLTATPEEKQEVEACLQEMKNKYVPKKELHDNMDDVRCNPVLKKVLAETKKQMDDVREKVATYPKYLSYEGSVVLCSLIGLKQSNNINLSGLPKSDIELIYSQLPSPETLEGGLQFSVELDDQQDFKMRCDAISENKSVPSRVFNLRFFNAVVRPDDVSSDIPIEKDGDKVTVGKKLVLDQHRIQKLVGNAPTEKPKGDDDALPRRQVVSGRNAFELRCDLVQMSMDLLIHNNRSNEISPEKVVATAKTLYSFVENRR